MENQTFFFNKNERRGILALGFLILFIFNIPRIHRWMIQDEMPNWEEITLAEEVEAKVEKVEASTPKKYNQKNSKKKPTYIKEKKVNQPKKVKADPQKKGHRKQKTKTVVFDFDPNHLSKDSLLLLGLSSFAVNNLMKYRNGGGHFFKKEDLKKIYGLESEQFNRIKDQIKIRRKAKEKPKSAPTYISINQADSTRWTKLKGIGPYYARKITEYRQNLGGFYSIQQVGETWALPDSTFQKIKPFLKLTASVKVFDINQVSYDELAQHPYFSFKKARIICNYIKQNGKIKNEQDLFAIQALDSSEVIRILPYMDFPPENLSLK